MANDSVKKADNTLFLCLFITNLTFVVLKLVGVINWSWWWVMSPLLAYAAMVVLALTTVLVLIFAWTFSQKNEKKTPFLDNLINNLKK